MDEQQAINLTASEQARLEAEIQAEIAAQLGDEPAVETLQAQGYSEQIWLTRSLDAISGAGRVLTLFVAEFAQAFAALALAVVFILLEAERISSGAQALGQAPAQSLMIAIAFTVANAVLPLYRLRNVRNQTTLTRTRPTLRGYLEAFWRRLVFKPAAYEVDVYDNPTLHLMESAVTWATIFMALYAVLGPMMSKYADQTWYTAIVAVFTQSNINQMIQLVAGALLSVGGVFGVQSISHEFGVRTIVDRPVRLVDLVEQHRTAHQQSALTIREQVRDRFVAGAIAEREARKLQKQPKREAVPEPEHAEEMGIAFSASPLSLPPTVAVYGNGHSHNGNDGIGGIK